jgi:glycerol-3-phosphate cytidylyltransferase-like family protein
MNYEELPILVKNEFYDFLADDAVIKSNILFKKSNSVTAYEIVSSIGFCHLIHFKDENKVNIITKFKPDFVVHEMIHHQGLKIAILNELSARFIAEEIPLCK